MSTPSTVGTQTSVRSQVGTNPQNVAPNSSGSAIDSNISIRTVNDSKQTQNQQ